MRSSLFDKQVLADHLVAMDSVDASRAAEVLIEHAERHPSIECEGVKKGYLRVFRYHIAGELTFAFIFNRASLLFYVRRPAIRRKCLNAILKALTMTALDSVTVSRLGEVKIRICNADEAWKVIEAVIEPIVADYEAAKTLTGKEAGMSKAIVRPAARVRQG